MSLVRTVRRGCQLFGGWVDACHQGDSRIQPFRGCHSQKRSIDEIMVLSQTSVEIRTTSYAGRGLFVTKSVSPGTSLLSGVAPLSRGKDYPEVIGKLMLATALEQVKGSSSLMSIIAPLIFPSNLATRQLSEAEEKELARGMREVHRFVNSNSGEAFELVEVDKEIYLRMWGVCALNAMRSPTSGQVALYGAVSLINHSCFPTCGLQFDSKDTISVVSLKRLEINTQITINYIEHQNLLGKEKVEHLLSNYNIICKGGSDCACIF